MILGWDFGTKETVLAAYEGLGKYDAGKQQNCKFATARRGACGRVEFSVSEGSSDTHACASAGETAKLSHMR